MLIDDMPAFRPMYIVGQQWTGNPVQNCRLDKNGNRYGNADKRQKEIEEKAATVQV